MCSHIQLSTRLECTAQVASVIQPYIVLILTVVLKITARSPTESRNYNPDRDQSTVGADHPGLPTSVDRRPNFFVDLLYSHRSSPVCVVNQDRIFHNH